ncbi:MAG: hypothetical protein IJK42_10720 [Prevotella sp.]|nr:hypothetical protein [Prevotella sp.]
MPKQTVFLLLAMPIQHGGASLPAHSHHVNDGRLLEFPWKKPDKIMSGIFCEIEWPTAELSPEKTPKTPKTGRICAFNIFWAAFIDDGCHIRRR